MAFGNLIHAETLAHHLEHPDWVVLDCRFSLADPGRGEAAYGQGHIPGARYVHLERDLSGPVTRASGRHPLPAVADLAAKLGRWGVDGGCQVVAYDDAGGAMAARMWWLLRWLGHEAVAVLDGGWAEWQREPRSISREVPASAPRRFAPTLEDVLWLTSHEVQGALADDTITLIDARSAARFRGEEEPLDPVAGHVPGALNHPYTRNLADDGRFLGPAELRRRYRALVGGVAPREVVHMCGSGVTACHNLLAMEVAGLTGSRLYPGSWSEWIREPARPVATGD